MQFLCVGPKVGATIAVFPRFDLTQALQAWSKYKSKSIGLVPPIAVVLAKTDLSGYDLSSVESVGCGAAPLGGEVEGAFSRGRVGFKALTFSGKDILSKKFNCEIKQGYGCTGMSQRRALLKCYSKPSRFVRGNLRRPPLPP